jgi:light-regulated signal transduction histidine kinase (bacteriophytochrome)
MKRIEKLRTELQISVHDLNNILNTLNGYAELLREADDGESSEEVIFYKEKIVSTLIRKLPAAKSIAEKLYTIHSEMGS